MFLVHGYESTENSCSFTKTSYSSSLVVNSRNAKIFRTV